MYLLLGQYCYYATTHIMNISFPVIGHVDHGKSTLCGHLLSLVGAISDHELEKIVKKAEEDKMLTHKWSRVLDICEEEQRKGKTNEYMDVEFKYKDNKFTIIDTPGHKIFIRSMIAGVSSCKQDLACLVVSCIPKEFDAGFERGQIKEDIILIRSVGITNLVVAVNKMDSELVNNDGYKLVVSKLEKFLKQLNFKTVTYVPVSGWTGDGLLSLLDTIVNIAASNKEKDIEDTKDEFFETKTIICTYTILSPDSIITIGYEGVCHIGTDEMPYKVDKILNKNVVFAKADMKLKLEVVISFDNYIDIKKDMRLIFRDKEKTVGFGKVLKIKPK
jgi:translation elongation factor EF-1alpha